MHTTPNPDTHYLAAVVMVVALPKDGGDPIPEGVDPLAWATLRTRDAATEAGLDVVADAGHYTAEVVEDLVDIPTPWEA